MIDVHLHKVLTEAVALPREAIHEWGGTMESDMAFIPFAAAAYLWNGEIEEMIAGIGIKPVEKTGDFLAVDDVLMWGEPIVDLIEIEFEVVVITEDIALDPCEGAAVFSVYAMPLVFIFEGVGTEATNIILLFNRDAGIDGFEDFDAGEDEKDTNFRLVGVVGGVTAKGRASAAVGDDCGNGTELRGGAAVEGGGEGEVYSFHFFFWIL